MPNIKQEVLQYILDNFIMGGSAADLSENDSFMDRHVIDSTGFIELIAFLERAYDIHVEDEEMIPENLDSLTNIERYVIRKMAAN